jgi:hypothetical protein
MQIFFKKKCPSSKLGFYLIYLYNIIRYGSSILELLRVFNARVARIKIYGVTYRFVQEFCELNDGEMYLLLIKKSDKSICFLHYKINIIEYNLFNLLNKITISQIPTFKLVSFKIKLLFEI